MGAPGRIECFPGNDVLENQAGKFRKWGGHGLLRAGCLKETWTLRRAAKGVGFLPVMKTLVLSWKRPREIAIL